MPPAPSVSWLPLEETKTLLDSPMGPFYAYLKDVHDRWSYLITFVNREAADEWWRMISTPPSPYAKNVERTSSQFYIQNESHYDGANFLTQPPLPDAQQFRKKMFVTLLHNPNNIRPMITVPPTTIVDHISGRWYFIRSKADPWSFWYFRTDGECLVCGDANCDTVHVSSEHRTKFCVSVRSTADDVQPPEDFVMIGRDEISITTPMESILHINDAGDLKATTGYQGGTDLLFNDLKNRFITRAKKQVNGEIWGYVVPVKRGLGEAWELMD